VDELYLASRRVLLDALEALADHRDAVILIGAHAVYLYTGEADVRVATRTKDSDLALDPGLLAADPLLEEAMSGAGFHRNLEGGQPGEWLSAEGIPVDLLVGRSLVDPRGSRGARIPPHSKHAARKVEGLEAAVVDNREMTIAALEPGDPRRIAVKVAGPAALAVAKSHKLGERAATPGRLVDKDAHDLYRLLAATETAEVAAGFALLLADPRSQAAARQALVYLAELFSEPTSLGSVMAGRAEQGVGDPALVAASVSALAGDLLVGVAAGAGN
jgi:Nucleotidyltransferase